ncbi:MAG: YggS family pyridoxal phosphate-dependent enzyme [Huintestinicola sp.]
MSDPVFFADIDENIKRIRFNIEEAKVKYGRENDEITAMAVTKTVTPQRINFAAMQGFTLLGENRVQEFLQKKEFYVKNAEIQFIGHLQSNKIKYIIDSVTMIQSVDSVSLAKEISKLAVKHGKTMDILCEVNIGGEESKSGFSPDALNESLCEISQLDGVRICGLMTIPPPVCGNVCFERMQRIFEDIRSDKICGDEFRVLSMGMSADYADAIGFGSTMVRIGSALFGARNYGTSI